MGELEHLLKRCFEQGSFVFRGQTTAVESIAPDVCDAAKKHLVDVAQQVFDRYDEAPVRAETSLAEKFLRTDNLKAVTSSIDPLGLVSVSSGTPSIDTNHKAIISIRDYVERNGTVDGKRIIEYFTDAPFGWSQDTLRYLIAAMLVSGEIKLKVSGREVTVNGQQAIDALRTNQAFKTIGLSLRDDRPSNEILARGAQRLTELIGDTVVPLEDEISKTAAKRFPQFQHQFGPLAERLDALGLPGAESIRALNQELADVLLTDASDAPQRLGSEESALYKGIKWASEVDRALKNGLEMTVRDLQQHRKDIEALPDSGIPGGLQQDLAEELVRLSEQMGRLDFFTNSADLSTMLTAVKSRTSDAAAAMAKAQSEMLKEAAEQLRRLPEWSELSQEEQSQVLSEIEEISVESADDLDGLKRLLSQSFVIRSRLEDIRRGILESAQERKLSRLEAAREKIREKGETKLVRHVRVPRSIESAERLKQLLHELQAIQDELKLYSEIQLNVEVED